MKRACAAAAMAGLLCLGLSAWAENAPANAAKDPKAAAEKPKDQKAVAPATKPGTKPPGGLPLTEDDIKALTDTFEKEDKKVQIMVSFGAPSLDDKATKEVQKKGKPVYRITAELMEYTMKKMKGGEKMVTSKLMDNVNFIVRDSKGNIVEKKMGMPIVKLSSKKESSSSGKEGFNGEVPEEGAYELIIWADTKKYGRLGKVMKDEFRVPKM